MYIYIYIYIYLFFFLYFFLSLLSVSFASGVREGRPPCP